MRILAIDLGERRTGVAVSDPTGLLATPLTVIESVGPRRDVERILELAREQGAERIVVGVPISLDGSAGAQAQQARTFAERLAAAGDVPVVTWDERLTTVVAERRMREAGASSRRRREQRDAAAAAVLLESYLDYLRLHPESEESAQPRRPS
jgi:putative Holliday junction resolvase